MYALCYPATGERATRTVYKSIGEAKGAMSLNHNWQEIKPLTKEDEAAFENRIDGQVLVLRKL
jgi:hypothetical protein